MRIKINLEYVLQKNNTTLSAFLKETGITSYAQLVSYCDENNFNPVEESVFNLTIEPKKPAVKKEKSINESPKKPAAKQNKSRSTSSTPAKKRGRTRSKKAQTTQ
tara:strand:- start:181 stop:495 length:315 start_codon:yes stop_codon:yes gene_type:complete